jgi:hypothetical protein
MKTEKGKRDLRAGLICLGVLLLIFIFFFNFINSINMSIDKTRQPGKYYGWQVVSFTEENAFRLPEEWVITRKDGNIYATDKPMSEEGFKYFVVGIAVIDEWDNDEVVSHLNKLFDDVKYIKSGDWGRGGSLGERWRKEHYIINGVETVKNQIKFYHDGTKRKENITLVIWDDSLDDEIIERIFHSIGGLQTQFQNDLFLFSTYGLLILAEIAIIFFVVKLSVSIRKSCINSGENND